jgi:Family of unknown function (DUF5335)
MRTREIPRNQWREFFDDFSRQHEGWVATIEIAGGETHGKRVEARELPLAGVGFDQKGSEPGAVEIEVGRDPSERLTHIVHDARRVVFSHSEDEAQLRLEIESTGGRKATVQLRRAARAERSRKAGG